MERFNDFFGGNITHQSILCKWTASQSAEGRIEATATGIVGGENFLGSFVGTAMQMHANIKVVVFVEDGSN